MQSLLCNLSNAIFAMQSLLCNLCYAIFAFLCFLSSDCKKHYKTCAFCNILLKMLENHWFSLVFASRVLENLMKPVLFAIFCWKYWKTIGFRLFFGLLLQKNLIKPVLFYILSIGIPIGIPLRTAGGGNCIHLVTTQVRTPKCKHCLGNEYLYFI